jgi:hypothetical protein
MKGHMTTEINDSALSKLRRMLSQKENPIGFPVAA